MIEAVADVQVHPLHRLLPQAMRQARRWLLASPAKVPHYVDGERRSGVLDAAADVARLATLPQAIEAVERAGQGWHLGFALGLDPDLQQHWQGIDFDHVVDDGALSDGTYRTLYQQTAGYAELSPSGAGLHVIGLGKPYAALRWPHGRTKGAAGIECYSGGRYFTVTGKAFRQGPDDLVDLADVVEGWRTRFAEELDAARPVRASQVHVAPAARDATSAAIEAWCAANPIESALVQHGFRRYGSRYLSPRSQTGLPGVRVLDERKAVSFHASDADLGSQVADGQAVVFDAFDLEVAHRFGGDRIRAIRETLPRSVPSRDQADACAPRIGPEDLPISNWRPAADDADTVPMPDPMPGPMADAVEWMLACAHREQPRLSLLAALVAFGSVCGSEYRLKDNTRLHLYGIGIVGTSMGKERPRTFAEAIAAEGGVPSMGGDGSGQGVEDALIANPAALMSIDEVGHLLALTEDAKAAPHHVQLAANLLRLWSASSSRFLCRALANKKGEESRRAIEHPTLSLLGFATPTSFAEGLTRGSVEKGLLGRVLLVEGAGKAKLRIMPAGMPMPDSVKHVLRQIHDARLRSRNGPGIVVLIESEQAVQAMADRFEEQAEASEPMIAAVLRRSSEKVVRIAGILAVLDAPDAPIMKQAHLAWAERMVAASNAAMATLAGQKVHASDATRDASRMLDAIKTLLKQPPTGSAVTASQIASIERGWVPWGLALKYCRLARKDALEAIEHLLDAGDLESDSVEVLSGRGRRQDVRVFRPV